MIIIIIKRVFHASGSQSEECIVDGSRDHDDKLEHDNMTS